jgi:DNA-directed RNA polymerase, mitochondrial
MTMAYSGGYYLLDSPLLKKGVYAHTESLHRPIPNQQILALNRIQETPWAVNPRVLEVLKEAFRSNSDIAGLPLADEQDLPSMLTDEQWEALSREEKAQVKMERAKVHDFNRSMTGRRESLLRKLQLADELVGGPIWFPHNVDWRGRAYAIPQDLNPQSDDTGRGLLTFNEGRPLGELGGYHLALRLAACFGMDKVSYEKRVEWVQSNQKLILNSAIDPLDGERFWCEADEPWQFLATCFEWVGWHNEGENYVCNMPIPFDATCSGLQHLSAMGLSENGGMQVNLTDIDQRFDVYSVVAEEVAKIVLRHMAEGSPLAHNWHGRVERNTVKQQVMTICYGVTAMGMKKMAIKKGFTNGMEGKANDNATYLTKCIEEAIGGVLNEGKQIMDWLQSSAEAIAEENQTMDFMTPIGMQVRQAYYKRTRKEIATLLGKSILWDESKEAGIDPARMKLGSVPNVIHAFDAAHLYLTVNRTASRAGHELSWAMIHDSFGTWAGESTRILNQSLRETFVEVYSENWLDRLYVDFSAQAHVPTPPKRGNLDINGVLRSRYFFS